jgi:hypothetical protein
MSEKLGQWSALRDWEVVRQLNEVVANVGALRRDYTPPEDRAAVKASLDAAISLIVQELPKLDIRFRVPAVEPVAVLWPSAEGSAPKGGRTGTETDAVDDLLE